MPGSLKHAHHAGSEHLLAGLDGGITPSVNNGFESLLALRMDVVGSFPR